MSSTPIKNGVTVGFPEYGNRYVRADIYRIGDTYVFVGPEFYRDDFVKADVEVTLEGNTIERDSQGYKLFVVPWRNCHFIDESIMEHRSGQV